MARYTDPEKMALIDQIDALRAEGMSQDLACGRVGIATSTYIRWRDKYRHDVGVGDMPTPVPTTRDPLLKIKRMEQELEALKNAVIKLTIENHQLQMSIAA